MNLGPSAHQSRNTEPFTHMSRIPVSKVASLLLPETSLSVLHLPPQISGCEATLKTEDQSLLPGTSPHHSWPCCRLLTQWPCAKHMEERPHRNGEQLADSIETLTMMRSCGAICQTSDDVYGWNSWGSLSSDTRGVLLRTRASTGPAPLEVLPWQTCRLLVQIAWKLWQSLSPREPQEMAPGVIGLQVGVECWRCWHTGGKLRVR